MYGPHQMMFGFPRIYQDIHDVRMKDAIVTTTTGSYYMNADAPIVHFNNASSINAYLPNGANHRIYWIDKIGGAGDVNICPAIGPAIAVLSFTGQGCMVHYDGTTWRVVMPPYPVVPYALLEDQKSSNTFAGTFTAGSWVTRELNTEVNDTHGIVSLSSNQFTLGAGTYYLRATAPALNVGGHQTRLYNATDATYIVEGSSEYSLGAEPYNYNQTHSMISHRFTITGSKAFEIRHQCQFTKASYGLGVGVGGFANYEVYTRVEIWRIGA